MVLYACFFVLDLYFLYVSEEIYGTFLGKLLIIFTLVDFALSLHSSWLYLKAKKEIWPLDFSRCPTTLDIFLLAVCFLMFVSLVLICLFQSFSPETRGLEIFLKFYTFFDFCNLTFFVMSAEFPVLLNKYICKLKNTGYKEILCLLPFSLYIPFYYESQEPVRLVLPPLSPQEVAHKYLSPACWVHKAQEACPICHEAMVKSASLACGHSLCPACGLWILLAERKLLCPLCRQDTAKDRTRDLRLD